MSSAANTNEKAPAEIKQFPAPVEDKTAPTETPPASVPVAAEGVRPAPARRKRGIGRFVLMAALPLLLVAGGTYVWVTGGRYEETENANLRQARVTIASESSGRIVQANIGENQKVQTGDVLFVVDPEPYRIALAQAEAALATARLNVEQLRSAYSQAQAKEKVTASDVR